MEIFFIHDIKSTGFMQESLYLVEIITKALNFLFFIENCKKVKQIPKMRISNSIKF